MTKNVLKNLLDQGKLQNVLDELKKLESSMDETFKHDLVVLQNKYSGYKRAKSMNTESFDTLSRAHEQILRSLLALVDQLPDDHASGKKRRVWIVVVFIPALIAIVFFTFFRKTHQTDTAPHQTITAKDSTNQAARSLPKTPGSPNSKPNNIKTGEISLTDCSKLQYPTDEVADLTARVRCCRRRNNMIEVSIQVSRKREGRLEMCINDPRWKCSALDNHNNQLKAEFIEYDGQKSKRCVEVNYMKDMGFVDIVVYFDQVDRTATALRKLVIPLTQGELVFNNVVIAGS